MVMQVLMSEPVMAANGCTYEKTDLQTWLQDSLLSPVTGNMMEHTNILPNSAIKRSIQAMLSQLAAEGQQPHQLAHLLAVQGLACFGLLAHLAQELACFLCKDTGNGLTHWYGSCLKPLFCMNNQQRLLTAPTNACRTDSLMSS